MFLDPDGGDDSTFTRNVLQKLEARFPQAEENNFKLFNSAHFNIDEDKVILKQQLAKGSYGVVYSASYKGGNVVVKIEQLQAGEAEQVNSLTELTVLQSISQNCPHIVKYIGAGKLQKSPTEAKIMILLEACENGALRERIFDTELSWSLITRLALDVSIGLKYLHDHNLVHRDIKTTNILIDSDWRAKICDFSFGIQVGKSGLVDQDEFIYGTTEFMSPEIALGEGFDMSADIFSFGIVLCEMICKCAPSSEFLNRQARDFFALDAEELKRCIVFDCPPSLQSLALQCCDSNPLMRPSAEYCVEWLEGIANDIDCDPNIVVKSLPHVSSDISVPLGLMTAFREGSVKFPRTPPVSSKQWSDMDSHKREKQSQLDTNDSMISQQILQMLQEMQARVSYLEIQVQELKVENRSLTKELTAIQHDHLSRHLASEQRAALSALSSEPNLENIVRCQQVPRSYTSRVVNPGSPIPKSPFYNQCLHSSNQNRVAVEAAAKLIREDECTEQLAKKVETIEKCMNVLLAKVEKRNHSENQCWDNLTEEYNEELAGSIMRCGSEHTLTKNKSGHCISSSSSTENEVSKDLAVTMEAFLQVAEKCSHARQQSLQVLSDIEKEMVSGTVLKGISPESTEITSSADKKFNRLNNNAGHISQISRPKSYLSQTPCKVNLDGTNNVTKAAQSDVLAEHCDDKMNDLNCPRYNGHDKVKENVNCIWRDVPSEEQYRSSGLLLDSNFTESVSRIDLSYHLEES